VASVVLIVCLVHSKCALCQGSSGSSRLLLLHAVIESSQCFCLHSLAATIHTQGGLWQSALALMSEAVNDGILLDSRSYSAALRACKHSGNWRKAVSLLSEAQQRSHVTADVVMYTEAIAACCAADRWEQGLALLQQMKEDSSVQPGIAAYSPLLEALLRAGLQQLAMQVYREACSNFRSRRMVVGGAAAAAAAAPTWTFLTKNNAQLDVRYHSPALAVLAVRCCLEQWQAKGTVLRRELAVIVGIDSTAADSCSPSAVQAAVQVAVKEVFTELRIKCTVPAKNSGRLLVPADGIMGYLNLAKRKQLLSQQHRARMKNSKRL
jgi:pentatricopeptide repeat protein